MSVRIIDIAKKLNISPTTVSMVLNHKGHFSLPLVQKIEQTAKSMGYVCKNHSTKPNRPLVIQLLKIATHGHILNQRHNTFFSEYLAGIEQKAKQLNCTIDLKFYDNLEIEEVVKLTNINFQQTPVDGFMIVGSELCLPDMVLLQQLKHPILFLDASFSFARADCFNIDNADGIFKAVEHLYKNGHRAIGLFKSSLITSNLNQRETAFYEAMHYFNLLVNQDWIVSVDPAYDEGFMTIDAYLKQGKTKATAFVCVNDMIAHSALKALKLHNYMIPKEISLVGFDDLPASTISAPPLTSIKVASHQIAEQALTTLHQHILHPEKNYQAQKVLIACSLVKRDSVYTIKKEGTTNE